MKKKHLHGLAGAALGYLLFPAIVFAQIVNPFKGVENLTGQNGLLEKLISIALQIGIPIMVLMIMWIGFQYVWEASKGKAANLATIHKNFQFTLLGAALLLGAYVILEILQNTFRSLQSR
ncbi:MAG: hypothetical protein V4674_03945 [Patescibacteria group bacterium]